MFQCQKVESFWSSHTTSTFSICTHNHHTIYNAKFILNAREESDNLHACVLLFLSQSIQYRIIFKNLSHFSFLNCKFSRLSAAFWWCWPRESTQHMKKATHKVFSVFFFSSAQFSSLSTYNFLFIFLKNKDFFPVASLQISLFVKLIENGLNRKVIRARLSVLLSVRGEKKVRKSY